MSTHVDGLVAVVAGCLLALLLVGLGTAFVRLVRGALGLLRLPRRRGAALLARLRGLRLRRIRALARSERARAAAATEEVRRLRAELRLLRAERDATLARMVAAVTRPGSPLGRQGRPDDRFQRAKRAFARRFHPDRLPPDAPDRRLRAALFREHWEELQRIGRG
jgi:hypothetical protein